MSIDQRTRRHKDVRALPRDEVFDSLFVEAVEQNGPLAARGIRYKSLPPLGLSVDGRSVTLRPGEDRLDIEEGTPTDGAIVELGAGALSELVQDRTTTMGLAMNSKVKVTQGEFDTWIGYEPVFRALLDGRPVHEAGAIVPRDRSGEPLDLGRSFTLEDDRNEVAHFLGEAGFLHVRGVFTEEEMAAVADDLDAAIAAAEPDDGASWWAGDSEGVQQAVRVLWFQEKSPALLELLRDDRLQWLAGLTGDEHKGRLSAEGLVKPLDIQTGLSDLPWHKDCGQGMHSYLCNAMTVGISITGADRESGALGVVPGSHRANVQTAGRDDSLDLTPLKLETKTGDLTVHCSDTLHRAHRPTKRPRKVVYTGFRLPPLPGDVIPKPEKAEERAARARLTNVRDRIGASGGNADRRGDIP